MQNFTLRTTGIKIFLFSFVLLMGSLSMRGQDDGCPTAGNTPSEQTFCYLQRVSEIETDGSAVYRSNDPEDVNYSTPVPSDELLMDGIYYVGSTDASCTERLAVEITVNTSPAPSTSFGPNFAPYLSSPSETYTVQDLIDVLDPTPGYEIVVFGSEFGTDQLPNTQQLVESENYFVGEAAVGECPSERIAIAYTPTFVVAPSGEASQTFCAGSTVADLVATSSYDNIQAFRWYSTSNSHPNLDESTELVDGETYYVSQIINDRNSPLPPTESIERFAVTVTVIPENFAGEDNTAELCTSGTAVNLLDYVSEDADQTGVFTLDEETIANGTFDPSTFEAGEYTVTYTVTNQCGEDDAVIIITISEQLEAPVVADQALCSATMPTIADIEAPEGITFYSDSELTNEISEDQELTAGIYYAVATNGTCNSEATAFNITLDEQPDAPVVADQDFCLLNTPTVANIDAPEGVIFYSDEGLTNELTEDQELISDIYYAVTTNGACTSEATAFEITVSEQPDTPTVVDQDFCQADVPTVANIDAPEGVVFYSDAELTNQLAEDEELATGTYYAAATNGTCTSEATAFEITVSEQPVAPTVTDQGFCQADAATIADIDAPEGVVFYSDAELTNELTEDEELTSATYYAVATNGSCNSDATSFQVTVSEQPIAPTVADQEFCEENAPTVASIEAPEGVVFYSDTELTTVLSEDEELTSATYYAVQPSEGCNSEAIAFTITIDPTANAGEDTVATLCTSDEAANLSDYLVDGQTGGTFTLNDETLENGIFDPSTRAEGEYDIVYTITNECGEDASTIVVNVTSQPEMPVVEDQTFCANINPTVADITAEDDVNFYTDENLQNQAAETDALESGTYYAARGGEACLSEADAFVITVNPSADAGQDVNQPVCLVDGAASLDLNSVLVDAEEGGNFELEGNTVATNYTFSEIGTYEFTYTVSNECGEDSAAITVEVNNTPEAPQVTDQEFCASEAPTVADLDLPEGVQVYANEDDTNPLATTDALQSGTYYASLEAGTCISDFGTFTITVNDPAQPTIDAASLELCEYNSYSIADLTAAITSTDGVIWYNAATGGDVLSEGTPLVNGTTYYAASYNESTGCESTSRLAYQVTFGDCPLVYPEGISPNGDGVNETFTVEGLAAKYPNYEMKVFNRWGNLVYKGNASTPDWDGTPNESSLGDDYLPVGVYFYVIEFNDGSTPAKQGKVFLSR